MLYRPKTDKKIPVIYTKEIIRGQFKSMLQFFLVAETKATNIAELH